MPRKKVTHEKVEITTPDEVVNGADEPVVTTTDASVIDPNAPMTLIPLVREAWNAVRGEDSHFDVCQPTFKRALLDHALSVLKSGVVLEGNSYWARFEQKIAELKGEN